MHYLYISILLIALIANIFTHKLFHSKEHFPTPKILVWFSALLFSFYLCFCILGQRFMPTNALFSFTVINSIYFLLLWANLYSMTLLLWNIAMEYKYVIRRERGSLMNSQSHVFIKYFSIIFAFLLIYWIFYFPGAMSPDSYGLYTRAVYGIPTDIHGVLYPVLLSWVLKIVQSSATPIFIHIVFASVTGALWIQYLYEKGMTQRYLLALVVLFWVLPNNAVLTMTLWKDVTYYYTYLCLLLVMLKLIESRNFETKRILLSSILAILLFLWRVNGILLTVVIYTWLVALAWQRKSYKYILYPALTALVIFSSIEILYKVYNIEKTSGERNTHTLIQQPLSVAYLLNHDDQLPKDMKEFAAYLPKEIWLKRSSLYGNSISGFPDHYQTNNSDIATWVSGISNMNIALGSGRNIIISYAKLWFTDFPLQLRTRLNLTPSLWNIYYPLTEIEGAVSPLMFINTHIPSTDVAAPLFAKTHQKTLTITKFIEYSARYLSGLLSLALCSILIIFFFFYDLSTNKLSKYAVIYVLWAAQNALLFLVATATDYRYSWVSLPTAFLLIMLHIFPIHNKFRNKEI